MAGILIFGGTSEGRRLAEYCRDNKIQAEVSVVSDYGKELLPDSPYITVRQKALSREEMKEWMENDRPGLVVDATHPYAACVTEYIKENCEDLHIPRLRVLRERALPGSSPVTVKASAAEAAEYLEGKEGNILLTTGSKELEAFTCLSGYEERIFARVLPSPMVIEKCYALGIKGKHIIAMQGPFSMELNKAMMEQLHIRFLVTKEAGTAGGFEEKLAAASETGAEAVVIGRPAEEAGVTLEEAKRYIRAFAGMEEEEDSEDEESQKKTRRKVFLVGTGMGGPGQFTEQGLWAVRQSQAVFGAVRMTESISFLPPGSAVIREYKAEHILSWLKNHREIKTCTVLYSGDTGFYSGASGFIRLLKEEESCGEAFDIQVIPGISTVSFMAARLGKPWQDMRLLSCHGRECRLEEVLDDMKGQEGIFLLTEGKDSVKVMCERLEKAEKERKERYHIYAGERLSYPDERITEGRAGELKKETFGSLTALWIEKEE